MPRTRAAGKALIDALIEEGKREGWSKLYWVTRENNPARKLYDKYGEADDYVRYRLSSKTSRPVFVSHCISVPDTYTGLQ
jgi:GNAT superfamily N-acetyltransferase